MFSPFPQFEELPIHLNIDWGERRRPIVVRLEQWPQSRHAVLVCHFHDEPEYGEWVVMAMNRVPHLIGSLGKLLGNRVVWDIASRSPIVTPVWREVRLGHLANIIERAFKGDNFQIGRILYLPHWPDEPRILLWCPNGASWCHDWSLRGGIPFEWMPAPLHLSNQQMLDMLDARWNEPDSDMHFAWQWANWSEQERVQNTTSYKGNFEDFAQLMRWVLVCMPPFDQPDVGWTWRLWSDQGDDDDSHWLWNNAHWPSTDDTQQQDFVELWSKFLRSHFVPHWRGDWLEKHSCAREFWNHIPLREVELESSPTMHERLEARIELREWLQKNAPESMDSLQF